MPNKWCALNNECAPDNPILPCRNKDRLQHASKSWLYIKITNMNAKMGSWEYHALAKASKHMDAPYEHQITPGRQGTE